MELDMAQYPRTKLGAMIMDMPIDRNMGETYAAGQRQIRDALIDIAERLGDDSGSLTLVMVENENIPGERAYIFKDEAGIQRGSLYIGR